MTRKKHPFTKAKQLEELLALYFKDTEDEHSAEQNDSKSEPATDAKKQKKEKGPEPFTIAGLSLHLGFDSKQAFEEYEINGQFASRLKRARLRIEALYEKKLHTQYTSGAIFALKSLGWNERPDKPADEAVNTVLKVEIIEAGPRLASSEQEVVL